MKKKELVGRSYNSGLIVGILIGIIITLLFVMGMLATGMVNFNNNINDDNNSDGNIDVVDEEKEEDNKFVITFKDEIKEYKNNKGEIVITNRRNIPVITNSSNQVAADKIVKYLTDLSNKQWVELNTNDYTKDDMLENLPLGIGVEYKYVVLVENKKYITFENIMSGSMGGVSWPGKWGYTFDTSSGNLLSHTDMFEDSSVDAFLYNYIVDEIKESSEEGSLWEDNVGYKNWKEVVRENMFADGNCYFSKEGLKFTFDKYSLGVGALGVPEVVVPSDKLNNYLRDEYKN